MVRIHCANCFKFLGTADVPTPAQLKKMVDDLPQAASTKDAIMRSAFNTVLPLLPAEAVDMFATVVPHYCPACTVEILGAATGGANHGAQESSGEAGDAGAGDGQQSGGTGRVTGPRAATGRDGGDDGGAGR